MAIPPSFTATPPAISATVEGGSGGHRAEIACGASGVPKPVISWFYTTEDGAGGRATEKIEVIDAAAAENNAEGAKYLATATGLAILNPTPDDAGVYTCHAENKFNAIEASGVLRVFRRTTAAITSGEEMTVNVHEAHYGTKPGNFETSIIHFPRE